MFQGVRVFDPASCFTAAIRKHMQPLSPNAARKRVAPGEGGFSAAHLRSESWAIGCRARRPSRCAPDP